MFPYGDMYFHVLCCYQHLSQHNRQNITRIGLKNTSRYIRPVFPIRLSLYNHTGWFLASFFHLPGYYTYLITTSWLILSLLLYLLKERATMRNHTISSTSFLIPEMLIWHYKNIHPASALPMTEFRDRNGQQYHPCDSIVTEWIVCTDTCMPSSNTNIFSNMERK